MTTKIIIDPITRIMGPLSIEVEIKKNKIVDAKSGGIQFRGFEKMLIGRPPLDAVYFTERICGICSTSHGLVASLVLEDALKVKPNENGVKIRNFVHGAEYLQNIMRQICIFVFPDYVDITLAPGNLDYDFRISEKYTEKINIDYVKALECSRLAHEIIALVGGKVPHNHGVFVGGTTANMDASKIMRLKSILHPISEFMSKNMVDDINIIAHYYPEYFKIGGGTENLLTYGLFHDLSNKEMQYVQPSSYIDGEVAILDPKAITESSAFSWYKDSKASEVPSKHPSETDIKKPGAYTFIKAPRYKGKVVQVGPLARMILSGSYKNNISTMDRLMARVLEGKNICEKMFIILESIEPILAVQDEYIIAESAQGIGLCDAVRGALGHWLTIEKGVIKNCDIVTPTAWNLSPIDELGQRGALESALIGTEIQNINNPVEIGRIVRSFDPCISCATHVNTEYGDPYYINIT
ncbi:nickel-dependent hydrogenase large subunit [Clostridium bowmanii]|uniref:nickel-dependent hydrogenase large subunit n=1 Tax=Clostridium bowmanii TaxID=132925 RepID=UPI001C0DCF25|nr:nickel-dependent hydrogenase large subunit [Clostridium bowmanii]MBU3188798.1 nickel-dependent hydrogenase large subunit [Clostridium bowmanii]MCA1073381.1 nickel-dependent hydrogenase large subunit [Clostridium bowmanii]